MADSNSAHRRGFSLVEALLALALFALVVAGLASGLLYANSLRAGVAARLEARIAARECLSVVRMMRDTEGLDALSEGTWRLVRDVTGWTLAATSDDAASDVSISDEDDGLKRIRCSATRGDPDAYTRTVESLLSP